MSWALKTWGSWRCHRKSRHTRPIFRLYTDWSMSNKCSIRIACLAQHVANLSSQKTITSLSALYVIAKHRRRRLSSASGRTFTEHHLFIQTQPLLPTISSWIIRLNSPASSQWCTLVLQRVIFTCRGRCLRIHFWFTIPLVNYLIRLVTIRRFSPVICKRVVQRCCSSFLKSLGSREPTKLWLFSIFTIFWIEKLWDKLQWTRHLNKIRMLLSGSEWSNGPIFSEWLSAGAQTKASLWSRKTTRMQLEIGAFDPTQLAEKVRRS